MNPVLFQYRYAFMTRYGLIPKYTKSLKDLAFTWTDHGHLEFKPLEEYCCLISNVLIHSNTTPTKEFFELFPRDTLFSQEKTRLDLMKQVKKRIGKFQSVGLPEDWFFTSLFDYSNQVHIPCKNIKETKL